MDIVYLGHGISVKGEHPIGPVYSAPNFGSRCPNPAWRQNSAHDCMARHYTELFNIICASSQYDNNLKGT